MIPHCITRMSLRSLSIVALLGLSVSAHAVCLNTDGSLDDRSMYTARVDRGLLPLCEPEMKTENATPLAAEPMYLKAQNGPAKAAPDIKKSVSDKKPAARANPS